MNVHFLHLRQLSHMEYESLDGEKDQVLILA